MHRDAMLSLRLTPAGLASLTVLAREAKTQRSVIVRVLLSEALADPDLMARVRERLTHKEEL